LATGRCRLVASLAITRGFPRLWPAPGLVTVALLTLAPRVPCGPVRLACLIHVANVHSEPGSNPSRWMSRLRGGHPFLRVEEFGWSRRESAGPEPAILAAVAESVPPAAPEGTAGHDGSRWLPSRVPTSLTIDRIVKESIRPEGGTPAGRPSSGWVHPTRSAEATCLVRRSPRPLFPACLTLRRAARFTDLSGISGPTRSAQLHPYDPSGRPVH
jgi:hypothetical protein